MAEVLDLKSEIKIENEEFEITTRSESCVKFQDLVLRNKFRIISDPIVLLERVPVVAALKNGPVRFNHRRKKEVAACDLAKIGNVNVPYNDPHTCYICKKIFASRRKLTVHLEKVHHKAPAMWCDQCPKIFTSKVSLTFHMAVHCKVKYFACDLCGHKVKIKSYLMRHMWTHNSKTKCKVCGKEVSCMFEHLRTHKRKKTCPICNKMISSHHLNRHIGTHGQGPLKCKDCGISFAIIKDLRQHTLKTHFTGKIHKCHCGLVFIGGGLKEHQKTHSGEVSCQFCSASFGHAAKLDYHLKKKHPDREKPKEKRSSTLVLKKGGKHLKNRRAVDLILKHKGPYICNTCGSKSLNRKSFMSHFRYKHLKQRPAKRVFSCDFCGHSNPRKKFFKLHMSRHRSKIDCKICHGRFVNIEKHLKVHIIDTSLADTEILGPQFKSAPVLLPLNGERLLRSSYRREANLPVKAESNDQIETSKAIIKVEVSEVEEEGETPVSPLKKRQTNVHKPKKQACPICRKMVPVNKISRHATTHDGSRYKCKDCGETFVSRHALRDHTLKQHYKGKIYECPCGSVFNYKQSLKSHFKLIHKDDTTEIYAIKVPEADPMLELARKGNEGVKFEEPHTCCFCKKIFLNRKTLKTHLMSVHKAAPPLFCDLCPKVYNTKVGLKDHMRVHSEKRFACDSCDFKTVYRTELNRHKVHHEPKVRCEVCNKEVQNLRNHMTSHLPRKRCPICNKTVEKGYFKDHVRRHEKNKAELKCSRCDETFVSYRNLRIHSLKQHYKGKLHDCFCGSVYKNFEGLALHQTKHFEENIICEVCNRVLTPNGFEPHWKIHHLKELGPFKSNVQPTKEKMVIVNLDGPFICDECGQEFADRVFFFKHLQQKKRL